MAQTSRRFLVSANARCGRPRLARLVERHERTTTMSCGLSGVPRRPAFHHAVGPTMALSVRYFGTSEMYAYVRRRTYSFFSKDDLRANTTVAANCLQRYSITPALWPAAAVGQMSLPLSVMRHEPPKLKPSHNRCPITVSWCDTSLDMCR